MERRERESTRESSIGGADRNRREHVSDDIRTLGAYSTEANFFLKY